MYYICNIDLHKKVCILVFFVLKFSLWALLIKARCLGTAVHQPHIQKTTFTGELQYHKWELTARTNNSQTKVVLNICHSVVCSSIISLPFAHVLLLWKIKLWIAHFYWSSFPNKQKHSDSSAAAMTSALGSNLSELDRLLLELNAVQQNAPSYSTTGKDEDPLKAFWM